jgi:hypothetical protein
MPDQSLVITKVTTPNEHLMVQVTTESGSAWISQYDAEALGIHVPRPVTIDVFVDGYTTSSVELTEDEALMLWEQWSTIRPSTPAIRRIRQQMADAIEKSLTGRNVLPPTIN